MFVYPTTFFSSPPAAAGGVPTIIDTQSGGVSSANPSRVTFTIPSGASTGDVIVVFAVGRSVSDDHSLSVGSELQELESPIGGQNYTMSAHAYTVTGGDVPGTTTFYVESTQSFMNFVAVAVTVTGTSGVDVSAAASDGSFNTTVTAPSVTTTGDDALILFGAGQLNTATYSSGTYTELAEPTIGSAGLAVYETEALTAGSTGVFNVTSSAAHYGYGITVALLP